MNDVCMCAQAHIHFVSAMLSLHGKYSKLFSDVFSGAQAFMGALDKVPSSHAS
jgi:hypothetical protein